MIFAGQSEIVRAHQKDQYFLGCFRNKVSASLFGYFGSRLWVKFQKEIQFVADICYFAVTTGSGLQTLGQEYCNIILLDENTRKAPTAKKLRLMILLEFIASYLSQQSLHTFKSLIRYTGRTDLQQQKNYVKLFDLLQQCMKVLDQLHRILFYLQGNFSELSQRILGIRHALIRRTLKDVSPNSIFNLLGGFMIIQFALGVPSLASRIIQSTLENRHFSPTILFWKQQQTERKQSFTPDEICISNEKNNFTCSLCLGKIMHVASTSCGHLFCWNCIIEWLSSKNECPTCRENMVASRLVLLRHFNVPKLTDMTKLDV